MKKHFTTFKNPNHQHYHLEETISTFSKQCAKKKGIIFFKIKILNMFQNKIASPNYQVPNLNKCRAMTIYSFILIIKVQECERRLKVHLVYDRFELADS
jgi:hypothetical protein